MPDPVRQSSAPGLLERRKLQAMLEIQDIALGLFESDGYRKVSVEQVAAAAGALRARSTATSAARNNWSFGTTSIPKPSPC
ncbi:hypothetical protein ACFWUP_03230 [Nocardia sp. NPDC058658]|uniref:hypothetical protein n=1 Tax=Nocardia sp. NPDC058658 TaxID=3346580 RepID=UPI00364F6456